MQNSQQLHKYVFSLVGVSLLFAVSLANAYVKVSNSEKFSGLPFKSFNLVGKLEENSSNNSPQKTIEKSIVNFASSSQELEQPTFISPTAGISDQVRLDNLTQQLYEQINQNWQNIPNFSKNLVYRVSLTPEAKIISFEAVNQPAKEYINETPLPNLVKSSVSELTSGKITPVDNFTVVFTPSGVLEVSP